MTPLLRRLLRHAKAKGLEPSALDEAVHDCAQDENLANLNGIADEDEQDDNISQVEGFAAEINNGGLEEQLEYLLKHNSEAEVKKLIDEAARDGPRSGQP